MTDEIIDATDELQRDLDVNAALVLWCFLMEQAMLIRASRSDEDDTWKKVLEYLVGMLEQGPKAEGLVGFAGSSSALAAEIARGDVKWEGLLEEVKAPGTLHVVEEDDG